mmetsp:Transcript_13298/g.37819  ORF Transcript_13298/g.37819 Transcript_13298/m.37819 type:complete len:80 (-) Transcript_13298:76-315(-)
MQRKETQCGKKSNHEVEGRVIDGDNLFSEKTIVRVAHNEFVFAFQSGRIEFVSASCSHCYFLFSPSFHFLSVLLLQHIQ